VADMNHRRAAVVIGASVDANGAEERQGTYRVGSVEMATITGPPRSNRQAETVRMERGL